MVLGKIMNKTKNWMIFIFMVLPIIYLILGYYFQTSFFTLLSVYGILVLLHLFFQMFFAAINNKKQQYKTSKDYFPTISVVVPTYNEGYHDLKECLFSIGKQNYPKFDVYLVDDGTETNHSELVYKEFKRTFPKIPIFYHHSAKNQGKRFAQKWAFDKLTSELVVTIDSDTELLPTTIYELTRPFYDQKVGAATGNVRGKNKYKRILTQLIDLRYWMAFNQERASQSLFGVTMCVCGVLGAYRTSILKNIKEKYVAQTFLGHICNFGDDRHLSNLVLNEGYNIYYTPKAKAYTDVPETLWKWLKQQLRWNKSFYREILWNVPSIKKHSLYLGMELFYQAFIPFFLLLNLILYTVKGINVDLRFILLYFTIMINIALLRTIYPLYKTKDIGFVMFPIYALLHIFLLLPIRLIALATLGFNGWGTR